MAELKQRIALIDADSIVHIVCNKQFKAGNRTIAGNVTRAVQEFIDDILVNSNSSHYIVFVQGMNHKNYRKKLYPNYKAHRKSNEALDLWKEVAIEAMKPYNPVVLKTIESDDAVSIYANATKAPFIVVSADKDLNSIPGTHFNPFKRNVTREEQWFLVTPAQAELQKWAQIAAGDGTDASLDDTGIEGLGMGVKGKPGKAIKLLTELNSNMYRPRVAEEYMRIYGVADGLRRMALTYDVIHILDKPEKRFPESESILTVVPNKYVKPNNVLFGDV